MDNTKNRNLVNKMLDHVEKVGNKLPDPVMIFISLCIVILGLSYIFNQIGISVINPADDKKVEAINLLSSENIMKIIIESVNNFATFPALGMVLVIMLGVGVAEKTGYFETLMKYTIDIAPKKLIIPVIIFVGIIGNVAGDAAPIILPPIAAMVFIKLGYHPIAGLAMAYAAALGGFAASWVIGMTDALALAFTEPATALVDETVHVNIAMNYYFLCVSGVVLLLVCWYVTMKVVIPRMGEYKGEAHDIQNEVTKVEKKAMIWANISGLIVIGTIILLCIPESSIFRNAETGSLVNDSPLTQSVVPIVAILFLIPGIVYGMISKQLKNSKDFAETLNDSMSSMGSFIVIVFFAAQMMAFFEWSNLGTIFAVKGAELLQGQHGILLIIGFIILSGLINMVMGSASAKWAILAPIFVPMMMYLDYHPAFTQILYRIGDSITNPITPVMPYLPLILAYAQKYNKNIGLGTLIATLLPYSIAFGIFWVILIVIWYLIGIPLGPGGPIHLGG